MQQTKSRTPLMFALVFWNKDSLQVLLDHGADPNVKDKNGQTSLHYASAEYGYSYFIEILLKHGAKINETDKNLRTPLILAVARENYDSVKILLNYKLDINHREKYGKTALYYAKRTNHTDIIELLTNHGATYSEIDVDQWPLNSM